MKIQDDENKQTKASKQQRKTHKNIVNRNKRQITETVDKWNGDETIDQQN